MEDAAVVASLRILLCDSDQASTSAIVRLLGMTEGCEVECCTSGADAIERLERERFDALILDTDLPLLDGFETLALIRQAEQLRTLPTVMVTRDRSHGSVVRSLDFAVVDYLLKPVRLQRLQVAVQAILRRIQRDVPPEPPLLLDAPDPRPRTLVVDGEEHYRDSMRAILEPHCVVATASSGAGALTEAWKEAPTVALIGRDIGPIGPVPLARYLAKLGTPTLIKVSNPEDLPAEAASWQYAGVAGRSLDAAVVLRDLRRFIKLPTVETNLLLQQLLEATPSLRDVIVNTTSSLFETRLGEGVELRETGPTDVMGAHALVDLTVGALAVRLAVQSTTDLIRQLADAGSADAANLQSSMGVLGEIAAGVATALQSGAVDRGASWSVSEPRFASGGSARDGEPEDAERLVVEMAPSGHGGRFRVVLDVWLPDDHVAQTTPEAERLSA